MYHFEKKYKEAMLRADEAVQKGCLDKDMFDIIFPPEESEDERIRKALIMLVQESLLVHQGCCKCFHEFTEEQLLAWLEKQKEQKPAWSEEDEKMLKCCLIAINHYEKTCNIGEHLPTKFNIDGYLASVDKVKSWLKSPRPQPKQEWSEEDKSILEALIYDIERLPMQGVLTHRPCDSYIKFLKALRPGWKPSEGQMDALCLCIPKSGQPCTLQSLYNDLKKL